MATGNFHERGPISSSDDNGNAEGHRLSGGETTEKMEGGGRHEADEGLLMAFCTD